MIPILLQFLWGNLLLRIIIRLSLKKFKRNYKIYVWLSLDFNVLKKEKKYSGFQVK